MVLSLPLLICCETLARIPFTEALILDPAYTTAHFWQGVVCSSLGHFRDARDAFREVTERPDHPLAWPATYNLALAFYHEFQGWANEKAIEHLRQLERELAQLEPDPLQQQLLALTHAALAATLAQRIISHGKEADKVLAEVEKHCKRATNSPAKNEIQAAVHSWGTARARASKQELAIADLREASRIRPGYTTVYVELAHLVEEKNIEEAIQWLERAVHWRPTYAYAQLQLGILLAKRGDTGNCKEAYRLGVGLPDAHNRLGELLAQEGYYEEALQEFEQAVQLKRTHARAWGNRAWWTVESGEQDARKLTNAFNWAKRAQRLNSRTRYEWFGHLAMGRVLLAQNKLDEAAAAFEKSVSWKRTKSRIVTI